MTSNFIQGSDLLSRQVSMSTLSPPYPPTTASLGGLPTKSLDIPITSVFLLLFLLGAIAHMTILQINQRRGHKFLMSGMLFGFCMARLVTCTMRIVWACYPQNVRVAIAAQIFVAAGVVLIFVINLLFAQRLLRGMHPGLWWSGPVHWAFIGVYILIVMTLIMLITSVIQSMYTLNANTKRIDRDIQLYGATLYAIIAFLPTSLVLAGLAIPRKQRPEKFGSGRWRYKIFILLGSSILMCLGAAFRAGVSYAGGIRPATDPAAYQSKACFYIFNFAIEIVVVFAYVVLRVDRRFYVPNKSHGPGDYSRHGNERAGEEEGKLERMISPEEEVFDDMTRTTLGFKEKETFGQERSHALDEEKGLGTGEAESLQHPQAAVLSSGKTVPA